MCRKTLMKLVTVDHPPAPTPTPQSSDESSLPVGGSLFSTDEMNPASSEETVTASPRAAVL